MRIAAAIPNAITALRLLLAPPICAALVGGRYWWALSIFTLAGLTDALDGYLARRLNAASRAGAYLDAVIDKLFVSGIYICLAWTGDVPLWLVILVFSRDALILLGVAALMRFSGIRRFPPSVWGKAATFAHVVTVTTVMAGRATSLAWIQAGGGALVWLAAAATVVSGVHYAISGVRAAHR